MFDDAGFRVKRGMTIGKRFPKKLNEYYTKRTQRAAPSVNLRKGLLRLFLLLICGARGYGRKTIFIAASFLSAMSKPAMSSSLNSCVMSGLIFTSPCAIGRIVSGTQT